MASVLDIAAVTMAGAMRQVEASAHNIANVNSPGYKRLVQMSAPFEAALQAQRGEVTAATGTTTATLQRSDLAAGRLSQTDNPQHLALSGDGFFVVRRGEQVAYTRAGAFERNADGRLVTREGAALQGDGGDIVVSGIEFKVLSDGTVVDDGRAIGRVLVVDVDGRAELQRTQSSGFMVSAERVTPREAAVVKQGYLEMANVDVSQEVVRTMQVMRQFELGQKLALAHSDMMESAIRRLGDLQS